MDVERIQIKPWVSVEQLQRFFIRADVLGLRREFYAVSVLVRKHVVERSFVFFHAELPILVRSSFAYERERAAVASDFEYDFATRLGIVFRGPFPLMKPNAV